MSTSCARCGRVSNADLDGDPPLAWSLEVRAGPDGPVRRWLCEGCARTHVRSIESKLDEEYWN